MRLSLPLLHLPPSPLDALIVFSPEKYTCVFLSISTSFLDGLEYFEYSGIPRVPASFVAYFCTFQLLSNLSPTEGQWLPYRGHDMETIFPSYFHTRIKLLSVNPKQDQRWFSSAENQFIRVNNKPLKVYLYDDRG